MVYAGRVASSFTAAAQLLDNLARLPVTAKQVERLTRAVGAERVAQRDAAVAAFVDKPLAQKFDAPQGVAPPELACVFVDGGRLQIRERTDQTPDAVGTVEVQAGQESWEPEEKSAKGHWREDKVGLLATLTAEPCASDPCPDIPPGFLDVLRIPILARALGKMAAVAEDAAEARVAAAAAPTAPAYEPPEVGRRQVVASCQPWPVFALVVAQAAHAAGFQKAKRQAFVADGAANNWRLRERFFGSFVAVLDFIHALSYVYAAAMAGRSFAVGWACYQEWIGWVWKGEVGRVIEQLRQRQEEVGRPEVDESETSVRRVLARTLGYLSNHQDKMKYPEYRRDGLPITSSLMESVVKQMNYRVKGSEKFWCQHGAEAIVQLRADHLSDDAPLEEFFRQRQANATGQRRYRSAG